MTKRLTNYFVQYVGIHDPGNPQTTFDSYLPSGHITISQIVGRIRQECLEYARPRNNEIPMKIINELVNNSNIQRRERFNVSDGIANWLRNQKVRVWR